MRPEYQSFLAGKAVMAHAIGMTPYPMRAAMFDFQVRATDFCLRRGRAALFLDTGLGKTICELTFAEQAAEASNGCSLILTPLAVARQIEREATRFGFAAHVVRDDSEVRQGINICNYDRLDKLGASRFGCVVLDESSILKSFMGKTTRALIEMFKDTPFRLAATATPAPNDHIELGTHAEFLGIMSQAEMLVRWFINDSNDTGVWRLKGHAVRNFWDWCSSWAVMAETPADLGFDASRFVLPPMEIIRHLAEATAVPTDGLFGFNVSATAIHDLKRKTAKARAELASEVIRKDLAGWTRRLAGDSGEMPLMQSGGLIIDQSDLCIRSASLIAEPGQESIPQESSSSPCDMPMALNCKITSLSSTARTVLALFAERERQEEMAGSMLTTATIPDESVGSSVTDAMSASGTSVISGKTSSGPLSTYNAQMSWVLWCDTNLEQSILENHLGDLAISITGSMSAERKIELHDSWLRGERPVLISKTSIFGFGVNWQHCARVMFLGRMFSYEQWYQAVRRCYRFGQKRPVHVHIIVAEGEDQIGRIIDRKAEDHAVMKAQMRAATKRMFGDNSQTRVPYRPTHEGSLPSWLSVA